MSLPYYARIMMDVIIDSLQLITAHSSYYNKVAYNLVICNVFDNILENSGVECPLYSGKYDGYKFMSIGVLNIAADNKLDEYQKWLIQVITSEDFRSKMSKNMNDKLGNSIINRTVLQYDDFEAIRIDIVDPSTHEISVAQNGNNNNSNVLTALVCILPIIMVFASFIYVKRLMKHIDDMVDEPHKNHKVDQKVMKEIIEESISDISDNDVTKAIIGNTESNIAV